MYVFLDLYVMDIKLGYGFSNHFFGIFILSYWTICRYKYMDYWMIYRYMLGNRASVDKK
jgi:hypothetical protein